MSATAMEQDVSTINLVRETEIAAPIGIAWEAVLLELGPEGTMPAEKGGEVPFPFVLEAWPGGRWFRDLGNKAGHLWGHVQVIKPPKLLEISGPMFMSYPGVNFVQYRLTEEGERTRLKLTHKAMGLIPASDREGVAEGWEHGIKRIREIAERLRGKGGR